MNADAKACANCAYWDPDILPQEPGKQLHGECHHVGAMSDKDGTGERWWCSGFWPKTVPLPEPWSLMSESVKFHTNVSLCPHGDPGVCMSCIRDAISAAVWDATQRQERR